MLRSISIVFFALCLIVAGDTAGKSLTIAGFNPAFVAWLRFLIAALVLLPLSGLKLSEVSALLSWKILLRGALIVAGISCILTALKTEPIANVFGAFFISPIVSFTLSVVLLKEKVTTTRTVLLLIGFVGVLFVVKPGFGGGVGILFALAAGGFHGAYLVATRWLAGAYRPRFLLISQLLLGAVVLSPFGLGLPSPEIDMTAAWLIGISALGSAAGNFMLVIASKTTPASLIAPLIYTQLIAATAAGFLVFGDFPDTPTLFGLALILCSGLLSFVNFGQLSARTAKSS
jgi:drug/metabolite transporter (DMT)-like permease